MPQFQITNQLLTEVEAISALRERMGAAAVELPWIPALQKDSRARNVHASTAIEGNPLTLEQVRAIEALGVSRQGAMDLLNPLLNAGIVEKVGGKKTGKYILKNS